MEELLILEDNTCECITLENNVGANLEELIALYQEELPFNTIDTLNGKCIIWDEDFINKILFAMSTNSLAEMSDVEKNTWYSFVEFQDTMSHSATTATDGAIGCTVPNELGKSFVVTTDGITAIECNVPQSSVQKAVQSKSLDNYLMNLLNCNEVNECETSSKEIIDIQPCII